MTDVTNDAINKMERDNFHALCRTIAGRKDFNRLVSEGIDAITDGEKQLLRLILAVYGIPLETTESDLALSAMARSIAARADKLR